jgi:hypothetical protein
LIELLVVVAILAILAALLLPALSRAKESGRAAVCSSNFRQIGLAATIYNGELGRYPSMTNWLFTPTVAQIDVSTGSLFPYAKSRAIYLCPTDQRQIDAQRPVPTVKRVHSYRMNCMMCHAHDAARCSAPAKTIFFIEATNSTSPYATVYPFLDGMMSPPPISGVPPAPILANGTFATRHDQRAFLLMNDIHVEKMNKLQYTTACLDKRFWYPNDRTDVGGTEEP